jgi:pimeloyl-ACP methyl ester carboxylesterase
MTKVNPYPGPMPPWPPFESYARRLELPGNGPDLFLYDTGQTDAAPQRSSPMLLIHGLGDEADAWRYTLPPLAADRRVIAPDLPGFGRSDKPKRAYTLSFYQETLFKLLDALEIDRVILVGHSLGGIIAHGMALARPQRVERLILLDGSLVAAGGRPSLGMLLFLIPGVGEWQYNRLRKDPEAAWRSLAPFYRDLDGLPPAEREFLYRRVNERVWDDDQRRAFFSILRSMARELPRRQKTLPQELAGLKVPTLAIWGEKDPLNPLENARKLIQLQPSARLVVIPNGGHNVHQEQPGAVVDAVMESI